MVCPICGNETYVTNSRPQKRNNNVWRRRKCSSCKVIFTTHETANLADLLNVEVQNGHFEPFLIDLLYSDLLLALQDRPDRYMAAREVSSTVIRKLLLQPNKPKYQTTQISKVAADVLKNLDRRAWLRYVAEHESLQ